MAEVFSFRACFKTVHQIFAVGRIMFQSIPVPIPSQLTANRIRESLGEGGSVAAAVTVAIVSLPVEDRSSAGIAPPPPLSPVTQDLFRPP